MTYADISHDHFPSFLISHKPFHNTNLLMLGSESAYGPGVHLTNNTDIKDSLDAKLPANNYLKNRKATA